MSRPTCAIINLAAWRHNLQTLRQYTPEKKLLAMVKANAYGHDVAVLAPVLKQADALGVACLEEAIGLRQLGLRQPIVLMAGFFSREELALIAHYDLQIVIHQRWQIEALEQCSMEHKALKIWLKINTGMHRLGFPPQELPQIIAKLAGIPQVAKPYGLMSHLAHGSDPQSEHNRNQWQTLLNHSQHELLQDISLANSAGSLQQLTAGQTWLRPGIALYGVSPFPHQSGGDLHLRPVMSLTSAIIAINHCPKGACIGYGGTWRCPEAMPVAVVAIGYGDGYPAAAPAGTPVLVNGQWVPIVGRVSMDMLTIDLRTQPHAQVGDRVVLWGEDLPVERVAKKVGRSPYELLSNLSPRVYRVCSTTTDEC
jgi:alanine racemase